LILSQDQTLMLNWLFPHRSREATFNAIAC
jgi:hypothetical protein